MSRPTEETRARLARSVRFTEQFTRSLAGPKQSTGPLRSGFWAEITGDERGAASGPTGYSWKRLVSDSAGSLQDDPDTITGTGTAFDVAGGAQLANGTRVWLRFAGYMDDGASNQVPIYLFTPGDHSFLAQITATAAMGAFDSRFVYTIEEVTLSIAASGGVPSSAGPVTLADGRTGKAINLAEIRNQDDTGIAFCVDRSADDYSSTGFAPRPITGGGEDNTHKLDQVVEILGAIVASDESIIYYFERQGIHDGSCSA